MKDIFSKIKNNFLKNIYLLTADIKNIKNNNLNKIRIFMKSKKIKIYFCKKKVFKKLYKLLNKENINNCGNYLFFFNSFNTFIKNFFKYKEKYRIYFKSLLINFREINKFDNSILNYKNKKHILNKIIFILNNFIKNFFNILFYLKNEKS